MNEASRMYIPPTCSATTSVTSSPESADGVTPCGSPDGLMTSPSGPEAVHASHSASPARDSEPQTPVTCGPNFTASSRSAVLQASLESRLRASLDAYGSPEYALTWKHWDMPSGPPICALLVSERRTSGNVCGGLPTPQCMDAKGYSDALRHKFRKTGHLKHWVHGTPLAIHSKTGKSSWPNPMLAEWMMGYPHAWISGRDYTPTATPSSRKSRRNSSEPALVDLL